MYSLLETVKMLENFQDQDFLVLNSWFSDYIALRFFCFPSSLSLWDVFLLHYFYRWMQ